MRPQALVEWHCSSNLSCFGRNEGEARGTDPLGAGRAAVAASQRPKPTREISDLDLFAIAAL